MLKYTTKANKHGSNLKVCLGKTEGHPGEFKSVFKRFLEWGQLILAEGMQSM